MAATLENDLALVTGLYRTTNATIRELDQRLVHDHDVTFVQAVTLLAINSFDRPQPHLVADYLSQQSQTVTGVIDRLERAGHVTRQRDLNDRRAVRLQLTDSGRRLVETISKTLREHTEAVFAGVPPRTKEQLREELGELEQSLHPDVMERAKVS